MEEQKKDSTNPQEIREVIEGLKASMHLNKDSEEEKNDSSQKEQLPKQYDECVNKALGNDSDSEEFVEATEFNEDFESKDKFLDDLDEVALNEMFDNISEDKLKELKELVNSLKNKGNDEYKKRNFTEAEQIYTQALNSCPLQFAQERSILYANRAAVRVLLENKDAALLDCNKAIELNPNYLRAILRRASLNRKMDNLDQSLEDYKKVLEMDPGNAEARQACVTLPSEINERNEKLKTEMLGKLKELGNAVLRPFGLSTENFNVVQDPSSGSYSINFQNNPPKT